MNSRQILAIGAAAVLCICALVMVQAGDSEADTSGSNNVAKTGDAEYATLQEAISAASDGGTVYVLSDVTEAVTIDKSLTLIGPATGDLLTVENGVPQKVNARDGEAVLSGKITITGAAVVLQNLSITNLVTVNAGCTDLTVTGCLLTGADQKAVGNPTSIKLNGTAKVTIEGNAWQSSDLKAYNLIEMSKDAVLTDGSSISGNYFAKGSNSNSQMLVTGVSGSLDISHNRFVYTDAGIRLAGSQSGQTAAIALDGNVVDETSYLGAGGLVTIQWYTTSNLYDKLTITVSDTVMDSDVPDVVLIGPAPQKRSDATQLYTIVVTIDGVEYDRDTLPTLEFMVTDRIPTDEAGKEIDWTKKGYSYNGVDLYKLQADDDIDGTVDGVMHGTFLVDAYLDGKATSTRCFVLDTTGDRTIMTIDGKEFVAFAYDASATDLSKILLFTTVEKAAAAVQHYGTVGEAVATVGDSEYPTLSDLMAAGPAEGTLLYDAYIDGSAAGTKSFTITSGDRTAFTIGGKTAVAYAIVKADGVTSIQLYTTAAKAEASGYGVAYIGDPVAKIGDVSYYTLSDAVAAGGNITLLCDVSESVAIAKSVVIDGAGHTIYGNIFLDAVGEAEGVYEVTIRDAVLDGSGKIGYGITAQNQANDVRPVVLTLKDVAIQNFTSKGAYLNSVQSLTVDGCSFNQNATTEQTWCTGDYALDINLCGITDAVITIKDTAFGGVNGGNAPVKITQRGGVGLTDDVNTDITTKTSASIKSLTISGCTFDLASEAKLGQIVIGSSPNKDDSARTYNQAFPVSITSAQDGTTVAFRGAVADGSEQFTQFVLGTGASVKTVPFYTTRSASTTGAIDATVKGQATLAGALQGHISLSVEGALTIADGMVIDASIVSGTNTVAFDGVKLTSTVISDGSIVGRFAAADGSAVTLTGAFTIGKEVRTVGAATINGLVLDGVTLSIPEGSEIVVPTGASVTAISGGKVDVDGDVKIYGSYSASTSGEGSVWASIGSSVDKTQITASFEQSLPTLVYESGSFAVKVGETLRIPITTTDTTVMTFAGVQGAVWDPSTSTIIWTADKAGSYRIMATPANGAVSGATATFKVTVTAAEEPEPEPEKKDGSDDGTAMALVVLAFVAVLVAIGAIFAGRYYVAILAVVVAIALAVGFFAVGGI